MANLNLATKRGPGSFSCGWTPLQIACAYGLEALTIKLIRAGADVNVKKSVKWTPLFEACHRGYSTAARELLKAGASHDIICPEFALCPFPGQRALAEAARQGHAETAKVLLEWGVDKNATNKLGWTTLHEVAYHSRLAIVKMLVVYGADVFAKTEKGSMAKDLTIHSEIHTMLDDLCQHGQPVTTSPKKEQLVQGDRDEAADGSASPKRGSPTKQQAARASAPCRSSCSNTRCASPYGQLFERQVIEAWFRDFGNRCPLTGETLKTQVREWKHDPRAAEDTASAETSEAATTSASDTHDAKPTAEEQSAIKEKTGEEKML